MRLLFSIGLILFAAGQIAFAHDPGLSSAVITLGPEGINARVTINRRDVLATGSSVDELAKNLLSLRVGDTAAPLISREVKVDSSNNTEFNLHFARIVAGGDLHIQSNVIERLPFGHRQLISIRQAAGQNLAECLISAKENAFDVHLVGAFSNPVATPGQFTQFFLLGIRHILTGSDHLRFLAGLLIVCSSFGAAARIITCFTIAHSITLALATFQVVVIPSHIVEPMIAASIVYVGLENLWTGGHLHWRELLTFVFGLVHGLGFASVLREMGIGTTNTGVAVPLFSFNFGVEAGQLLVAACLLPIALKLKRVERFPRMAVPAFSVVIASAGAFWFCQRIME